MKTAEIHRNLIEGETLPYTWAATMIVRHLNPARDSKETVQFGGTDRFSDPYEAEQVIADKIAAGFAIEFPGYSHEAINVWKFDKASDARL